MSIEDMIAEREAFLRVAWQPAVRALAVVVKLDLEQRARLGAATGAHLDYPAPPRPGPNGKGWSLLASSLAHELEALGVSHADPSIGIGAAPRGQHIAAAIDNPHEETWRARVRERAAAAQ